MASVRYKSVDGGEKKEVEADSHVQLEGGLLTISKPTEKDAGNYTCSFSTAAVATENVEETIHVISECGAGGTDTLTQTLTPTLALTRWRRQSMSSVSAGGTDTEKY